MSKNIGERAEWSGSRHPRSARLLAFLPHVRSARRIPWRPDFHSRSNLIRLRFLSGAAGSRLIAFAFMSGMLLVATGSVSAQIERSPAIQGAIDRGATFLLSRTARIELGQDSLAALALIKCNVPESDPSLAARLERVFASVAGNVFEPRNDHNGIYSAGIVAMVRSEEHTSELQSH